MWCRIVNEKGNYRHNTYGYLFDLKCVKDIYDINDDNPNWREFNSKEEALNLYNLSFIKDTKKTKQYASSRMSR